MFWEVELLRFCIPLNTWQAVSETSLPRQLIALVLTRITCAPEIQKNKHQITYQSKKTLTTKPQFRRLLHHLARKRSGLILMSSEPSMECLGANCPWKCPGNVRKGNDSRKCPVPMHDYKSLCAVFMICATLVNIQTHMQANSFWLAIQFIYLLLRQMAAWHTVGQKVIYSVSQKKVAPPLKLFAIFSLVVNLCNWKLSWLLPKHIPISTPILVHLSEYLYKLYYFY